MLFNSNRIETVAVAAVLAVLACGRDGAAHDISFGAVPFGNVECRFPPRRNHNDGAVAGAVPIGFGGHPFVPSQAPANVSAGFGEYLSPESAPATQSGYPADHRFAASVPAPDASLVYPAGFRHAESAPLHATPRESVGDYVPASDCGASAGGWGVPYPAAPGRTPPVTLHPCPACNGAGYNKAALDFAADYGLSEPGSAPQRTTCPCCRGAKTLTHQELHEVNTCPERFSTMTGDIGLSSSYYRNLATESQARVQQQHETELSRAKANGPVHAHDARDIRLHGASGTYFGPAPWVK